MNINEAYLTAINKLVGILYPSRSELIRVAVRDFLLRELKMAKDMAYYDRSEEEVKEDFDEENFVRVPIEKVNEKSEPIREYKTYKIIKDFNSIKELKIDAPEEIPKEINNTETYDDIPLPSNYNHPTLTQQRQAYPNLPDYKFINERLG